MWEEAFSFLGGGQGSQCSLATRAIATCAKITQWGNALQVLEGFDVNALQVNLVHCNAAISACEKGHRWIKAFQILTGLDKLQPDIISFNTCMSACKAWHMVLELLAEVNRRNVQMQTITYNAAISSAYAVWCGALMLFACLPGQQLRSSIVSYGAVTRSCDPGGQWKAALDFMASSCNDGLKTSVVLYGSGISSCETASQRRSALRLFFNQQILRLQVGAIAATAAMSSCERVLKQWRQSLALLPLMHWISIQPNMVAINIALRSTAWPMALRMQALTSVVSLGSLAHAMDRVGDWAMACNFLAEAFSQHQQSNAVVAGSLISACEGNEEWQKAVHLLVAHQRQQLESNLVMRSACASAGISASAWQRGLQTLLPSDAATDGVANGALVSAWKAGWCWPRAVVALAALPQSFLPAVSAAAAACAVSASWSFALEVLDVAKDLQDAVASEVLSDACTKAGQGQCVAQILKESNDNSLAALQLKRAHKEQMGASSSC